MLLQKLGMKWIVLSGLVLLGAVLFGPNHLDLTGLNSSTSEDYALTRAVYFNDRNAVQSLLREGTSVDENLAFEKAMLTPLMVSVALNRDPAIIDMLLAHGADPADSFLGITALDLVVWREHTTLRDVVASALR